MIHHTLVRGETEVSQHFDSDAPCGFDGAGRAQEVVWFRHDARGNATLQHECHLAIVRATVCNAAARPYFSFALSSN